MIAKSKPATTKHGARGSGVTLHGHKQLNRALAKLARDIYARFRSERDHVDVRPTLALVGVRTGGWHLAQRLARLIDEQSHEHVDIGALDIGWHRDDAPPGEGAGSLYLGSDIGFDVTPRYIVVVDDVIFTGRTVRAAIDTLLGMGRPRLVRLAVVVDRGHREVPVHADHLCWTIESAHDDDVQIELTEDGCAEDSVAVYRR